MTPAQIQKLIKSDWKKGHLKHAARQGWNLFSHDDNTLHIQKLDDPDVAAYDYGMPEGSIPELKSDEAALTVVFTNAAQGDKTCLLALYLHNSETDYPE